MNYPNDDILDHRVPDGASHSDREQMLPRDKDEAVTDLLSSCRFCKQLYLSSGRCECIWEKS